CLLFRIACPREDVGQRRVVNVASQEIGEQIAEWPVRERLSVRWATSKGDMRSFGRTQLREKLLDQARLASPCRRYHRGKLRSLRLTNALIQERELRNLPLAADQWRP